ncbi:methyltransferase domain-containing protein [Streptomyces sp. Edi4]|uniref:class I SAM-dependent methyltransferase n=1 Tax=Streptomyces sp. Edi4 TaxID=3162527 RepID=UPI003305F6F3
MSAIVNTEQDSAWNGDEGQYWADHHDRWNAVNEGFNEPLLRAAAIAPGERVLDLGCGAGQTSRLAARRAHPGQVLGLDLSAPELDRARALAAQEGLDNLRFERGDAQVHPFSPGSFDVALSRFGIMFFADPAAAFAHVRGALRPGGRLAFASLSAPERMDWAGLFADLRAFGPVPDFTVGAPGMFSLADPATIRQLLTGAGFDDVRVDLVTAQMNFGKDAADAAVFLAGSGPARSLLERLAPGEAERAREAMRQALARFEGPGGVRLNAEACLVSARC